MTVFRRVLTSPFHSTTPLPHDKPYILIRISIYGIVVVKRVQDAYQAPENTTKSFFFKKISR